ncbi:hypothetical protein FAJ35_05520 [Streptococcus suis]|uniref:Uncharacterized protein n=1 Tax=Streptococcus suis TaxID=1307 RepID=A0A4T2GS70_STRSU|nr:hypothetical protein FAJ35_05520 [Streptococcus suis]
MHSRTKSSIPLLLIRVNISAQWLIGRFVRASHSKSDLINCAGAVRRTQFLQVEFCTAPTYLSEIRATVFTFLQ